LLTAAAATACSWKRERSPLARAAQYLWAQQAADGGFHSATYGLLRSAQSLTPFVLGALLRVSEATVPAPSGALDRAIAFIRRHTSVEGAVGATPGDAGYPNYATALAVDALVTAQRRLPAVAGTAKAGSWTADIAPMVAQLRAQQFSEANGWTREHTAYGGWGMGGAIRRPPDAGHVDLSMTRFVLEALRAAGVHGSDPAMARARVFLERSQNRDGGFFFSPVTPALNKAGQTAEGFVSYGTATADGVLALRRLDCRTAMTELPAGSHGSTRITSPTRYRASRRMRVRRLRGEQDCASTTPPRSHGCDLSTAFDCRSRQTTAVFATPTVASRKTIR
jgi:hypothetical protein